MAPTGNLAHNQDTCPDWESNQLPFGLEPVLNPLSYTSQGKMQNISMSMRPFMLSFGSHTHLLPLLTLSLTTGSY